ncbi:putative bifunctional diguanylate cyclase/phosphodiesterase [Halomonas beimenensis]|uniref:Diguanylate cyclase/phosphodiesterase (GGDEF & EAL domains) with PAS/PAC sensor(S) n=1 Tax=Halomonas beimenensis TaxID=475662 RepID=A0A291PCR9_9GAMM|nr:GGDEF domain-containing phosphodiesterase [Halomonas beimenensis]ATJ84658.1 diguanylate cyclase/phosphodiesterase (GGDEF & EAL domains) with PAS/PAC sensor(s) [Halomonas beimenensis]
MARQEGGRVDGVTEEECRPRHCGCDGEASVEALVAESFHHAGEAMLITAQDGRILAANEAFRAMTGQAHEAMIGEPLERFLLREAQSRDADDAPGRRQVSYRNALGRVCPAIMSRVPVQTENGRPCHHVITLVDLATHGDRDGPGASHHDFDALTGLPNLQLLTRLIQEAMHRVRLRGGRLTVCSLDIDHFKQLNDRLGQTLGDLVLSTFAYRIRQLLQDDDILARIGGDEFVLLLHHGTDEADLGRLLEAIRRPLRLGERTLQLTASLGVSSFPGDDVAGDVLLRHATQAMYRAKQRGRNTFHVFDPTRDRELQVRQERRQRFARAVADQELRLHYQPQIDMTDGRVIGLEALVRWQHPEEGLLSPAAFLPLVEGSSLESVLGEWVIDQALRQLSAWQSDGLPLCVHVNISPAHLLAEDFTERLASLLQRHDRVPRGRLKLEVLETAAMHDIEAAQAVMRHCQALGIDFALDDFGTGFSSLTNLRRLPVDLIKIDQSFVRAMLDDPDDRAIVESVVFMARRFGRPLLAEGVETLAHARALVALGCTLAQGYGIARPMPAASLPAWLREWSGRHGWHAIGMS